MRTEGLSHGLIADSCVGVFGIVNMAWHLKRRTREAKHLSGSVCFTLRSVHIGLSTIATRNEPANILYLGLS